MREMTLLTYNDATTPLHTISMYVGILLPLAAILLVLSPSSTAIKFLFRWLTRDENNGTILNISNHLSQNSWKPNLHRSEPLPEERGEVQSRYQNYDQSNIAKRAEAEAAWKAWVARKEEDAKSRRSSQPPVKKETELSERELMKKRANEGTSL